MIVKRLYQHLYSLYVAGQIQGLTDQNSVLLMNAEVKGFYRVNYDLENWKRLAARLRACPSVKQSLVFATICAGNSVVLLCLGYQCEKQSTTTQ